MFLKAGEWIDDRYRIIRSLGKGGQGSVYLAVQERIYKFFAVKVMKKEEACFSPESIELWKRMSHRGIPEIVDVIETQEEICLVMEYIEGRTLNDVVNQEGIPSLRHIISWGIQICEILEYLHGQKPPVIFGDVKPANLILQKDRVVLVDFGSTVMLKSRGKRIGTREYVPPWKKEKTWTEDVETDLYGLGKTLEFLMLGGQTDKGVSEKKTEGIPKSFRKILYGCTAEEGEKRYREVKECRAALEKQQNRRWVLTALFLLSVITAAAAARSLCLENTAAGTACRYEALMTEAREEVIPVQRELFLEAIRLEPDREDAYMGLLENMLADGRLTKEEDICLRTILKESEGDGKCHEEILKENGEGYAEVSYKIAMAYWYFYEEEGGKTYAAGWFGKVQETPEDVFDDSKKRMRSRIYEKIGGYRARLELGSRTGEEKVSYKEYWEDLMELLAVPEEETGNKILTLYFWQEILVQISHYMLEFENDGITAAQMKGTAEKIRKNADKMEEESKEIKTEKEQLMKTWETVMEMLEQM